MTSYYQINGQNALPQPGTIIAYLGKNPPDGWMLCDGQIVNRAGFPDLANVVTMTSPMQIPSLYAWYDASSWNNSTATPANTWMDKTGNGRNATSSGTITRTTISGVDTLIGGITANITFPSNVLSSNYTLFHVAKYNGTNKGRIITSDTVATNFLSGFHSNKSGVAFHGVWITLENDIYQDNWVISSDQKNLYRGLGVNLTKSPTPTTGTNTTTLTINGYSTTEKSDWAVAEVIVYNRELSRSEIERVEAYLSKKYNIPITQSTTFPLPNLQGLFLRGLGEFETNYKSGSTIGTIQEDMFISHNHSFGITASNAGSSGATAYRTNVSQTFQSTTTLNGSTETRPYNYGVNWIIKTDLNPNVPGQPIISSITYNGTNIIIAFSAPSFNPGGTTLTYEVSFDGFTIIQPTSTSSPITIPFNITSGDISKIYLRAKNANGAGQAAIQNIESLLNVDTALNQYYPYDSYISTNKNLWNYNDYFKNPSATITNNINSGSTAVTIDPSTFVVGNSSIFFSGSTQFRYNTVSINPNFVTISFWARSSSNGTTYNIQRLVSFGSGSNFMVFQTYRGGDNFIGFHLSSGGIYPSIINIQSAYNDTWYHFAYVYSGTTLTLYINGQSNRTASGSSSISDITTSITISGNDVPGNKSYIDDLRFYTRALTASEILAIYNYRGNL